MRLSVATRLKTMALSETQMFVSGAAPTLDSTMGYNITTLGSSGPVSDSEPAL